MRVTSADQFAALHGEMFVDQFAVGNFFAAGARFAVFKSDCILGTFEVRAGQFENLLASVGARELAPPFP